MRATGTAGVLLVAAMLVPPASAQPPASAGAPLDAVAPRQGTTPPRVEISLLGGVIGGADLGDTRASQLTNQLPVSGTAALFTTRTSVGAAPVLEGRLGLRIAGGWVVEAGLAYARPELRVDVTDDVEGAADVTATSALSQYIVDGAVQYRWRGDRVTPFVTGGAGYLRQLDPPQTTAETGAVYFGGGGVLVRLAPHSRGFARRLSVRGDARLVWLRDGVRLLSQRPPTFSLAGGLSVGW